MLVATASRDRRKNSAREASPVLMSSCAASWNAASASWKVRFLDSEGVPNCVVAFRT